MRMELMNLIFFYNCCTKSNIQLILFFFVKKVSNIVSLFLTYFQIMLNMVTNSLVKKFIQANHIFINLKILIFVIFFFD